MALRGIENQTFVENANKCFLSCIGMEYGEELDCVEVLEKTIEALSSTSEVI